MTFNKMLAFKHLLICVFVIGLTFMKPSDGCRCLRKHPQEYYCNADYVIKGTPTEMRTESPNSVYVFKNITLLKKNERSNNLLGDDSLEILTSSSEASCGIEFNLNREYIITGDLYNSRIYVNLCGFNMRWENLTKFQRNGFSFIYQKGCTCGIAVDYDNRSTDNSENIDVCTEGASSIHCYHQHSVCLRQNNQCKFIRSTPLMECLGN